MTRTTFQRTTGLAALALTMSLGLAACGGDDTDATASDGSSMSASEGMSESPSMSDDMSDSADGAMDPAAQTFGTACEAVPATGDGSFDGMATEPVATAAGANPLLTTLVTAVKKAGLVDTLNGADGITVFAPTDDAFAKIPTKTLNGVLKDKNTLTAILTHHVVAGELSPEDVAGTHETLNGDSIEVRGSGEEFTVGAENAQVLCGNIPTANATVYVIDTVLMP